MTKLKVYGAKCKKYDSSGGLGVISSMIFFLWIYLFKEIVCHLYMRYDWNLYYNEISMVKEKKKNTRKRKAKSAGVGNKHILIFL